MDRVSLIDHVNQKHRSIPAVCPICITYPHGDPNYVSNDLSGHLKVRHRYDMGEVIENDVDED